MLPSARSAIVSGGPVVFYAVRGGQGRTEDGRRFGRQDLRLASWLGRCVLTRTQAEMGVFFYRCFALQYLHSVASRFLSKAPLPTIRRAPGKPSISDQSIFGGDGDTPQGGGGRHGDPLGLAAPIII